MAQENEIGSPAQSAEKRLPQITVVGATGFIGSHLARRLDSQGHAYESLARDADLRERDLGCVIYCAGVTADFRSRPLDAVDAHVSHLVHVLRDARVSSLVYLSSSRVYRRSASPATEDSLLGCDPNQLEDLYDISKMLGESVSLLSTPRAHVLRLSNVYGHDPKSPTFLASIIRQALETGEIVLRTALTSAKDYIGIDDVIDVILDIVREGTQSIYNVACGRNTSHGALVAAISKITDCRVRVAPGAPEIVEPVISIQRLEDEFAFAPAVLLDGLSDLVDAIASSGR